MKTLLLYYTGTYNTRYITNLLKDKFRSSCVVDTYEVSGFNNNILDFNDYDIIGIGYPIYAFNIPYPFLKFLKNQKFINNKKYFIYKNSGETYEINSASSKSLIKLLQSYNIFVSNEYHFMMPYNINFRFDEKLVKEIMIMDDRLADIVKYEIFNNIKSIKSYKYKYKLCTDIFKIQYIAGNVNSFFYKIDKNKCINCGKCISNCPTNNIYYNKDGNIKFHHKCIMCMRCSLICPTNAIKIGLLNKWKVNKEYNFDKIKDIKLDKDYITKDTKGFFKCYIKTYEQINKRYKEIKEEGK